MTTRVLVTGGASGLGLALATQYAARGAQVLACDLGEARPEALPDGTAYQRLDVREQADWDAARDWVRKQWGGLDLLFNNAGIASGGRIDVETIENWQRVIEVNLLGVVRGCRTFTPMFKTQGSGYIVNTASLAGLVHGPGMASYNAVKAGVVALSETLNFELQPFGIGVSVVCPAFFQTNLHTSLQGSDTAMERTAKRLISTATATADEVATLVLAGVEAGELIIFTDRLGRETYRSKQYARPLYDKGFRDGAAKLAQKSPGDPPASPRL
ncbi:MAG: SDR family NAD(P)-dependent oxidoreductase [Dermatophilaceae bacterium]